MFGFSHTDAPFQVRSCKLLSSTAEGLPPPASRATVQPFTRALLILWIVPSLLAELHNTHHMFSSEPWSTAPHASAQCQQLRHGGGIPLGPLGIKKWRMQNLLQRSLCTCWSDIPNNPCTCFWLLPPALRKHHQSYLSPFARWDVWTSLGSVENWKMAQEEYWCLLVYLLVKCLQDSKTSPVVWTQPLYIKMTLTTEPLRTEFHPQQLCPVFQLQGSKLQMLHAKVNVKREHLGFKLKCSLSFVQLLLSSYVWKVFLRDVKMRLAASA